MNQWSSVWVVGALALVGLIEDGDDGENMWDCSGKDVKITGAKQ